MIQQPTEKLDRFVPEESLCSRRSIGPSQMKIMNYSYGLQFLVNQPMKTVMA
jgi:hypothetical protein